MHNAPEEFEYRYWSKTQWMVFQKNGDNQVVVDEGVNPINMIPMEQGAGMMDVADGNSDAGN